MQELNLYQMKILQNDTTEAPLPDWLLPEQTAPVQSFHRSIPQYQPTPLISLPEIAKAGGVKALLIKNEGERFGLRAFKALGSSWAVARLLGDKLGIAPAELTLAALQQPEAQRQIQQQGLALCTATDGNHGRGLAWTAKLLGCPAHIYMPAGAEPERVQAIADLGAEVCPTDLSYDETVALAAAEAKRQGWLLVQDTSLPGYEEIPKLIIQGYSTVAAELAEQIREEPTHIFLQAGVGSMAGGMLAFCRLRWPQAKFIILEPSQVACCYLAAQTKNPAAAIGGVQQTIMAGLNCGTPCSLIMPLLAAGAHFFMTCPDFAAAHGMRLAARRTPPFVSGESGAVALGAAALLIQEPTLAPARELLGIDENSVLLGINTEAAMAPKIWRQAVQENKWPLP